MFLGYQIFMLFILIVLIAAAVVCTIFGHFEIINAIIMGYGVWYFLKTATYLPKLVIVLATIAAFIAFWVLQSKFFVIMIIGGIVSTGFLAYKTYLAEFKFENANIIAAAGVGLIVIGLNILSMKKKAPRKKKAVSCE